MKAEELDKRFDDNEEDLLEHLDLKTAKRPNQVQKRVNVDFPTWMIVIPTANTGHFVKRVA